MSEMAPERPRLSAWCCTAPGVPRHDSQHRVCQMRLDDGHLDRCGCDEYGGHESPVVERDSASASGRMGNESGPESASTDRGLATVSTRPKGA